MNSNILSETGELIINLSGTYTPPEFRELINTIIMNKDTDSVRSFSHKQTKITSVIFVIDSPPNTDVKGTRLYKIITTLEKFTNVSNIIIHSISSKFTDIELLEFDEYKALKNYYIKNKSK